LTVIREKEKLKKGKRKNNSLSVWHLLMQRNGVSSRETGPSLFRSFLPWKILHETSELESKL